MHGRREIRADNETGITTGVSRGRKDDFTDPRTPYLRFEGV